MSKITRPVIVSDALAFQKFYPYGVYTVSGKVDVSSTAVLTLATSASFPDGDDGGSLFSVVNLGGFGSSVVADRDVWVTGMLSVESGNAAILHTLEVAIGELGDNYGQTGGILVARETIAIGRASATIPISLPLKKGQGFSIHFNDTNVTPIGILAITSISPA